MGDAHADGSDQYSARDGSSELSRAIGPSVFLNKVGINFSEMPAAARMPGMRNNHCRWGLNDMAPRKSAGANAATSPAKTALKKSKSTKVELTIETLAKLGAKRLAVLLLEASEADPILARQLRMELMKDNPDAMAREIDKQIASLRRARGFMDWRKVRELEKTLDALRASIAGPMLAADATLALERLLSFFTLGGPTANRSDDSNGRLQPIFTQACEDFAAALATLHPDLQFPFASQAYATAEADDYGLLDALNGAMIARLGKPALDAMRTSITVKLEALPPEDPVNYRFDYRRVFHLTALAAIADAQGDVDAFIAAEMQKSPRLRDDAGMARRLISANCASEALNHLDKVDPGNTMRMSDVEEARIEALDALGRNDDAQADRWRAFERRLSSAPLRAYLKRLPDFDADEKLEEALAFAARQDLSQALAFLLDWPALREAGALVRQRMKELNGDLYHIYAPAADALETKDPLSATLLRRAMIDFTLQRARTSRYDHAARHFVECAGIAPLISDWMDVPDHTAFVARLKTEHPRKMGFWARVAEHGGKV